MKVEIPQKIINQLYFLQTNHRHKICPKGPLIGRVFKDFDPHKIKAVIIGQDPYPQPGVADGLAFSCSLTNKTQPSLDILLEELESSMYPGLFQIHDNRMTDLSHWHEQGVLLINASLTCNAYQPGSHREVWKEFISNFVYELSEINSNIVWSFLGKVAQEHIKDLHPFSYKAAIEYPHPAAQAYGKVQFVGCNLFKNISRFYPEIQWLNKELCQITEGMEMIGKEK